MSKTVSTEGINLIKKWEGFISTAVRYQVGTDFNGKPIYDSPYYTIGYGHCNSDVKPGQKITVSQGTEILKKDLEYHCKIVNNKNYCHVADKLNQNQFDALVSITYNCGPGGLLALCKGRTIKQIGDAITSHYTTSNGVYLQGLANRRKDEQALFNRPIISGGNSMSVIIGQASIDERGYASGGQSGDQTGNECNTRSWYSYPWDTYLECIDEKIAKKAASYMKSICDSAAFGYDQGQRWTGLQAIIKNGKNVSGASNSEFDCSSLVLSCYALAGLKLNGVNMNNPLSSWGYTGDMCGTLMATGKFKKYTSSEYINGCSKAKLGGVYLNTQCHVCMVVSAPNGKASSVVSSAASNKVKVTKNSGLYKYNEKDVIGKSSVAITSIPKGTVIEWVKDDHYGWSLVKYKGKEYWMVNSHLDKAGLSSYIRMRFNAGSTFRRISNDGKKLETNTITKSAHTVRVVCQITRGKFKGYYYGVLLTNDEHSGREYYIKVK